MVCEHPCEQLCASERGAAVQVLGDMPQKTFAFRREREPTAPLALPGGETPQAALARVLALPAVGSKRFLTTKADRSVTGAPPVARTLHPRC